MESLASGLARLADASGLALRAVGRLLDRRLTRQAALRVTTGLRRLRSQRKPARLKLLNSRWNPVTDSHSAPNATKMTSGRLKFFRINIGRRSAHNRVVEPL